MQKDHFAIMTFIPLKENKNKKKQMNGSRCVNTLTVRCYILWRYENQPGVEVVGT